VTRVRTREWSSTDYYAVLGVDSAAAPADVDARYRELAKELHPDRNADPEDQERFKRISAAYTALKDPSTRSAYDEFRARVEAGSLYVPVARSTARPGPRPAPDHLAPPRIPKVRAPMPPWLRGVIATGLIVLGLIAALWALLGDLPAPTNADTPIAVQITLGIVALKLLACGVAVGRYPQLRARWHH
jgi:hypothetical protein